MTRIAPNRAPTPRRAAAAAWAALAVFSFVSASAQTPFRSPSVDAPDNLPEVGYRYASLERQERSALRRGFRLPLDALFSAKSPADLVASAQLRPLPDPNTPFLPVDANNASVDRDPFGEAAPAADGGDGLGALGRLFALESGLSGVAASDPAASGSAPTADAGDPFSDDDPFAAAEAPAEPAEPVDPFADEEAMDPDDDPFADF